MAPPRPRAGGDPRGSVERVAVGETWFALAEERDTLEGVAEALGGAVREVLSTGTPASDEPPGCP